MTVEAIILRSVAIKKPWQSVGEMIWLHNISRLISRSASLKTMHFSFQENSRLKMSKYFISFFSFLLRNYTNITKAQFELYKEYSLYHNMLFDFVFLILTIVLMAIFYHSKKSQNITLLLLSQMKIGFTYSAPPPKKKSEIRVKNTPSEVRLK